MGKKKIISIRAAFVALFCLGVFLCFSQTPPGIQEFGDATSEIRRNYRALTQLIVPLGAIFGLVGGIRVYNNWQSGMHHIDAQVMGWFGACLFLQLVSVFIGVLY